MVNGRTDAEDMERQYQLSALRDTFAAAALTGLLANPHDDLLASDNCYATSAYELADAMLRERERPDRPQPFKPADATPDTHATPDEGTVQDKCTLTVEERASIKSAAIAFDREGNDISAVLRHLLERLA
jgi:hypothetical protein